MAANNYAARGARNRSGFSIVQVMACITAVGVGAWAGALYMQVEVEDLAYTALDEADLLETVPEEWRPVRSDCPPEGCPPVVPPEEEQAQLAAELEDLQHEIAELRDAAEAGEPIPPASHDPEPSEADPLTVRRERTLAYWGQLAAVAAQVADLEKEIQPAINAATTGHVFEIRRRSFDYARRAIEAIPSDKVDRQAIEGGKRLATWYANGAAFYEQATLVWDGLAAAERAPVAEAALEKSRQQHGKEAQLVRAKMQLISSQLGRRYAVAFPAINL